VGVHSGDNIARGGPESRVEARRNDSLRVVHDVQPWSGHGRMLQPLPRTVLRTSVGNHNLVWLPTLRLQTGKHGSHSGNLIAYGNDN